MPAQSDSMARCRIMQSDIAMGRRQSIVDSQPSRTGCDDLTGVAAECRTATERRPSLAGRPSGTGRPGEPRRPSVASGRPARGVTGARNDVDPAGVGLGLDLAAAVVLGPGDDPEFLGLARLGRRAARRSRGRCRRPWRRGSSARGAGRAAPTAARCRGTGSSAAAASAMPADPAEEREDPASACAVQKSSAADVDLGPAEDVGEHRAAGREGAVGDDAPDVGLVGRRRTSAVAAAPADAEEAEAGRVVVGPRPQVGERRLEVADLVVGHPLERLVVRVAARCRRGCGSRSVKMSKPRSRRSSA